MCNTTNTSRLDRTLADTHALVAETGRRLAAEHGTFQKERSVLVLLAVGAAGGEGATGARLILEALRWLP
jgi:hypothetical protein